jgi:EsV-1-7 cysteine-rich motif
MEPTPAKVEPRKPLSKEELKIIVNSNKKRAWTCQEINCEKSASFNLPNESIAAFCGKHRKLNMINVRCRKCRAENCNTVCNFNFKGESKGIFCAVHKQPGMIDIRGRLCQADNCNKWALFNLKSESKGIFCGDHKTSEMINVVSKKCQAENCSKRCCFNFPGETKGLFCAIHKHVGMININNKKCKAEGCERVPHFGFKNELIGIFCGAHKQHGMIHVDRQKCKAPNCNKTASFNKPEETKGIFCATHKLSGMIDISKRKCCKLCHKRASFNHLGKSKGIFCADHKQPDMINVVYKKCEICSTVASYGIPSHKPSRCAKHKLEGMCIRPTSKCRAKNCEELALYGITRPIHCGLHQENDEANLCLQRCKRCSSIEICNKDGLCFEYCINSELFKRHNHRKELRIKKLLENKIDQSFYSYDKVIDSSCSLRRPDFAYDCKTHYTIIEVDENQHSGYLESCEISRMKEITQSIGMPTIFIRYNPDEYKSDNELNKTKREQKLIESINHCMTLEPKNSDEFLRVMYLFYDGFEPDNASIKNIQMI